MHVLNHNLASNNTDADALCNGCSAHDTVIVLYTTKHQRKVHHRRYKGMFKTGFPDVLQIMFTKNSQQGILDVLAGTADAALARADILSDMQYAGQINASDFKCVTAVSFGHYAATMHGHGSCMQRVGIIIHVLARSASHTCGLACRHCPSYSLSSAGELFALQHHVLSRTCCRQSGRSEREKRGCSGLGLNGTILLAFLWCDKSHCIDIWRLLFHCFHHPSCNAEQSLGVQRGL